MDFGDILDRWEREQREAARGGERDPPGKGHREKNRTMEAHKPAPGTPKNPAGPKASETGGEKPSVRPKPVAKRDRALEVLDSWLATHGVYDKDEDSGMGAEDPRRLEAEREAEIRRFSAMHPDSTLDLHGMSADAAEAALSAFLFDSARSGFQKVLVVHGKGIHSKDGPVLGALARRVIEASPWAGRFGAASRASGGSGALWVAIRK